MTDTSIMPYGKYRGEKMANIPASYLLWMYDNDKCGMDIKMYIATNLDVLRAEVNRESKKNNAR